jgi:hypothetical protein
MRVRRVRRVRRTEKEEGRNVPGAAVVILTESINQVAIVSREVPVQNLISYLVT